MAYQCRGGRAIDAADHRRVQLLPIRLDRNNSLLRASDVLMDTINSLVGTKLVFRDTRLICGNICNSFVETPDTGITIRDTSFNFMGPLGTKSYSDPTPSKL